MLPGGSRGESASLPLSSFRGCQHPLTHGRFPPSKPGARSRVLAMHRPNVCFLLSLLFLPCLSLAKACLGFTSTIQNFYTLVLRPAGLAALIPSPAPVPFVVQHDALIGSGMRAQMSMRRPVFLPPPHCVAMQIPGLRCSQGWNPCLWLWSLHLACGHRGGEAGGGARRKQSRWGFFWSLFHRPIFLQSVSSPRCLCSCVPSSCSEKPEAQSRAGEGHMPGGLNLRVRCMYVYVREMGNGEAGRVPRRRTPASQVGSPDSQSLAFLFQRALSHLVTFNLFIRPRLALEAACGSCSHF